MSIIICRNNSRLIFVKTITGAIWRSNEQLTSLLRNGNRDGNRNLASALLETVSLFLFILFSDLLERSESKIVRGDTETQSSAHTVIGAADQSINSFDKFIVLPVHSSFCSVVCEVCSVFGDFSTGLRLDVEIVCRRFL